MIAIAVVLAVVVFGGILLFNRMIAMRRLAQNAWSDVDVFLRRRAELVPNLVETVRAAATHEQRTLAEVADARSRALAISAPAARGIVESEVSRGVANVVAIAESHPVLRASDHFRQLQDSLTDTERLIADARRYYNACVRDYNTMIESFPHLIVASVGGFRPLEFFQVEELNERRAPSVSGING